MNKLPKYTSNLIHKLNEFYNNDSLEFILSDCEGICQIEKSYLKKKTDYELNNDEYLKLRIFRYTTYLEDIYNETIKKWNIVEDLPNIELIYNSINRTNMLRYIKEKYEPNK